MRVLSSVTSDHFKASIVLKLKKFVKLKISLNQKFIISYPLEWESNFQNMSTGLNEFQNTMDLAFFLLLRNFHSEKVKKIGISEKFCEIKKLTFWGWIFTQNFVKIGHLGKMSKGYTVTQIYKTGTQKLTQI